MSSMPKKLRDSERLLYSSRSLSRSLGSLAGARSSLTIASVCLGTPSRRCLAWLVLQLLVFTKLRARNEGGAAFGAL